jgi:glycosyltransferase involved in cell wall biosynthesis
MKISYQILCKNEDTSLYDLLELLVNNISNEDEINVCRDLTGENPKTLEVIEKFKNYINYYERILSHTIHNQKNFLAEKATRDYLFYLDADELLNPKFLKKIKIIIKQHSEFDVIRLPRINIIEGITKQYPDVHGRSKYKTHDIINFPDTQSRIFKHNLGIQYHEIPHGDVINYFTCTTLPLVFFCAIYHKKPLEKQLRDNIWHYNKQKEMGLV